MKIVLAIADSAEAIYVDGELLTDSDEDSPLDDFLSYFVLNATEDVQYERLLVRLSTVEDFPEALSDLERR